MRKILSVLAILFLLSSCANDLDLNEGWKDIPIVYGIIEPSDTAQYIRVERALTNAKTSALELAKNADSLYYDEVEVSLLKGSDKYVLERVDGNLEGYQREEGLFVDDPNYLYKINTSELNLEGNELVRLNIKRPGIEKPVEAVVKTLGHYFFNKPRPDNPHKINWSYATYETIRWTNSKNAVEYEVYVVTHYKEKSKSDPDAVFVAKKDVWRVAKGVEDNHVDIFGKDYYIHIGAAIPNDDDKIREFKNFEFKVLAIGQELKDYVYVNSVNLGITASQEIPIYTNLSDGLGIFASSWEINFEGLRILNGSLDSLINGVYTKHLNFE